jgi:gamma-glutamyltranspeptidase / glutathione hydrolase
MNFVKHTTFIGLIWLGLLSCQLPSERSEAARETGARGGAASALATPIETGVLGAAASSEANATLAALEILERGGNAVDAAVALNFALAVTYPAAGNLGGGGFFLYRSPEGESWFLDFREVAPLAATHDMYVRADGSLDSAASTRGWKAAGVPGSVFGMWKAHQRWGKLPWNELVKPAIYLAEQGFRITAGEAAGLNSERAAFEADLRTSEMFVRADGEDWKKGDLLVQTSLASTLHAIAEQGEAAFREGPIVNAMVAASNEGGGILHGDDFATYEPVIRPVHTVDWRGMQVLTVTPPSSGAVFLAQTLDALDRFPLDAWGFRDARTVQLLGEVEAASFRDRNRWLGDPASMERPYGDLLDPGYLNRRARAFRADQYTAPDDAFPGPPKESFETTHFSVLDAQGGAASITTTLNSGYGAKVAAPGGFFMNNEMDDFAALPGRANQYGLAQGESNAVVAGRRPLSSMCPVIVVRGGQIDAVIGSPGGPTILTTVLQILLNRYVFEMSPEDAVAAPRFHRQDRPATLRYEPGRLGRPNLLKLRELGQPLAETRSIGDVNAIFRDGSEWAAVADPRREGLGQVSSKPDKP